MSIESGLIEAAERQRVPIEVTLLRPFVWQRWQVAALESVGWAASEGIQAHLLSAYLAPSSPGQLLFSRCSSDLSAPSPACLH